MKVLVTGGAGFIGSHLVDFLVKKNFEVRVLDNLSTGDIKNLKDSYDKIEFIKGDIRDFETCLRATMGMEAIFHLAALGSVPRSIAEPELSLTVNLGGTVNIFSSALKNNIKKIIYASSSSVYGDSKELPKKEGKEGKPLSPYAYSKKTNEELAKLFKETYDIDFIGLRYFNVYGPRQTPEGPYAAVIPRFFKNCLNNNPPEIFGDGTQTRDFTYVEDAVLGTYNALFAKNGAWNRIYNISGGKRVSVNELAKEILNICKLNMKPIYLPERKGDVKHSLADLNLSKQLLNYNPSVDLKRGLEKSKRYYMELFK